MTRLYNFCAGPAALPLPVLEQARDEITDWHGKGLSIMEMSHRSKEFVAVAAQAEQDLRDLLKNSGQLQSAVYAGRRPQSVQHGADEPAARWQKS